nr:hypothetical protein [Tanacetum cinerariifolium]
MAPLTFVDTHNMIVFLTKFNASEGFDQIVDFLNAHTIQYALMINPSIYVSCIKQFWASVSVKKANDVVTLQALIDRKKVVITEDTIRQALQLDDADGIECLPSEEIFAELARMGYEKPPPKLTFYKAFFLAQWKFLIHTIVQCRKFNFSKYIFDNMVRNMDSPSKFIMYPWFLKVKINAQVDDLSSHNTKYTSSALTEKVFANIRRIGKGFSRVETPLFDTMLLQPQVQDAAEVDAEDEEDDEVSAAPTPPSPTPATTSPPPQQEPIPSPPQAQPAQPSSPPQEQPTQPTYTSKSSMTFLNTLMETWGIVELYADEDVILVDVDTAVEIDADTQERMEKDVTAVKEINAAESEPTVFDDEEVTMTMAQILIKMKAEKQRILDEQMAKRL